jgi:hypothetical protein
MHLLKGSYTMMLPEATIEIIGTEIFDMEKIEDIEKYL